MLAYYFIFLDKSGTYTHDHRKGNSNQIKRIRHIIYPQGTPNSYAGSALNNIFAPSFQRAITLNGCKVL